MAKRVTSIATPVAHLVGPGKIKIVNGRLAFSTGNGSPTRLDPARLQHLICYGDVGITDEAMTMLFRHGVQTAWMSRQGHQCRGRLVRADASTTRLRIAQHHALGQAAHRLEIAREWVARKVSSQIEAAAHYRRHGKPHAIKLPALQAALDQCRLAETIETLRGVEGSSSLAWFKMFGKLIKPPFQFRQRTRRPPTDPVNALLSLGYTFLVTRAGSLCEARGLETALGALHEYRPGRPSLACDLIEPLRVPLVDRWVIALCNNRRLDPDDFESAQTGGVKLKKPRFGAALADFEEHWHQQTGDRRLEAQIEYFVGAVRRLGHPSWLSEGPDEDVAEKIV